MSKNHDVLLTDHVLSGSHTIRITETCFRLNLDFDNITDRVILVHWLDSQCGITLTTNIKIGYQKLKKTEFRYKSIPTVCELYCWLCKYWQCVNTVENTDYVS